MPARRYVQVHKSVDLAAAWNDGLNIQVQGYLKGQLVDSQTVVVNPSGPSLFTFNYQDIDTLKFVSSGGTFDPAYQAYASSSPAGPHRRPALLPAPTSGREP